LDALDPAHDAWLGALDDATAPRIVPPSPAAIPGCSGPAVVENTARGVGARTPPAGVALLSGAAALRAFAASSHLRLPGHVESELLKNAAGESLVALLYPASDGGFWTETLRLVSPPGALDLRGFLPESGLRVPVTLFSIGAGRAQLAGVSEITLASLAPTWNVAEGRSHYIPRRQLSTSQPDEHFVVEASSASAFFDEQAVAAEPSPSLIPALVSAYFERTATPGSNAGTLLACTQAVEVARSRGTASVGLACAPGTLFSSQAAGACRERPSTEHIAPASLRCGSADDVALAFSGKVLADARLTRHAGELRATNAASLKASYASGDVVNPVLRATSFDISGCPRPGAGHGYGGTLGLGGTYGSAGVGGSDVGHGGDQNGPGYGEQEEFAYASHEGCSCAGALAASSSASDDEGDSCSSDSAHDSDDDSCSGDSGDSEADDGCSSSDDSGYDGETCGDDSSGYDGETCGGDSKDDEDACAVRRPRAFQPRLSALTLLAAAVLLPLRRRARRSAAASGARAHGRATRN
jgi:hypothetical protein